MTLTADNAQKIVLDTAPAIPGLTFRGFRGEPDYLGMAEIINAASIEDQVEGIATVEEIARTYDFIQRSDTDADMIFAEVDGESIGYGRCMWNLVRDTEEYYTYGFFVHLKPDWRGMGIGKAMAGHLIDRIAAISQQHPAEARKYLESGGSDTQVWQDQLMKFLGLEPVRYGISMTRPCSLPVEALPLPDGIEIRPIDESKLRQVFDAQAEAFQDHWGFVAPTEKDFQRWQQSPTFDPSLWKVAWEGDEVVGMVLNFINEEYNQNYNRKRGYTENISTRRPWRRRGVARALLSQSIQMFQKMDMEETALGVDTENPSGALNLYTSLGYTEIKRHIAYRKPLN